MLVFIVPSGLLVVLGVQKCDRSVFFFFYCKSDVLVDGVKMEVELCTIFTSDTHMALSTYLYHHLGGWGVVFKALSSMGSNLVTSYEFFAGNCCCPSRQIHSLYLLVGW